MSAADRPLITVAVATYRRPRELERAMHSVLAEPGDYFDLLVGDDASPDETPSVVSRLSGDPRVVGYRNTTNLGMRENYLELLRQARGEYVFILTDDDWLLPGALAWARRVIEAHPDIGYMLSDLPTVDEQTGQVVNLHRTFPRDTLVPPGIDFLPSLMRSAWVLSRQVIRRDWIDWKTWQTYKNNIFFPMIIAGRLLLRAPAFYLSARLVMHTWFNPVYWNAFGRDRLEVEFNLARDAHDALRAVLHDYERKPPVSRMLDEWETDAFKSYLYRPRDGFGDYLAREGWAAAVARLRAGFPLSAPQRRHLFAFRMIYPFWRTAIQLRAAARRVVPARVWSWARRMAGRA